MRNITSHNYSDTVSSLLSPQFFDINWGLRYYVNISNQHAHCLIVQNLIF